MYIYRCEDNIDSIFTAVYDAWASCYGLNNVRIEVQNGRDSCYNMELFSEYIDVATDEEKAEKVATAIRRKISEKAYQMVVYAALSAEPEKANRILHFLRLGFQVGGNVVNRLGDKAVIDMFELNRYVGNEVHFFKGFLRFEEIEAGILFAKYEPSADISGILMPHFVDRFPNENIVILDVKRKKAAIYESEKAWFVSEVPDSFVRLAETVTETEADYKTLWRKYFQSIAIEARENAKLQRNMIRLHFRKHMTEFMSE